MSPYGSPRKRRWRPAALALAAAATLTATACGGGHDGDELAAVALRQINVVTDTLNDAENCEAASLALSRLRSSIDQVNQINATLLGPSGGSVSNAMQRDLQRAAGDAQSVARRHTTRCEPTPVSLQRFERETAVWYTGYLNSL